MNVVIAFLEHRNGTRSLSHLFRQQTLRDTP
jgi:hypothetical protein